MNAQPRSDPCAPNWEGRTRRSSAAPPCASSRSHDRHHAAHHAAYHAAYDGDGVRSASCEELSKLEGAAAAEGAEVRVEEAAAAEERAAAAAAACTRCHSERGVFVLGRFAF